jgi:hypothetical protein
MELRWGTPRQWRALEPRIVLPEPIHLVDRDALLVAAWREVFREFNEVVPERRDFFEQPADAMVAPGNSFGIVDGGLDAAIRDALGPAIEGRVRAIEVPGRMARFQHGAAPSPAGAWRCSSQRIARRTPLGASGPSARPQISGDRRDQELG